jgi:lipoate-protein ligase A
MRWRLARFDTYNAAMNMAIDEAVSEAIRDGISPPTIRFYRWQPSAITIGCFQSIHDEVDLEECQRQSVDVVRRRTGGGAVFHDHNGEITYSVIAPESLMGPDIQASYQEVCGWVMDALRELKLEPEYRPVNDITVGGKKISGCAQTRREGVFLQHGTVLFSIDRTKMFSLLKVGALKNSDKAIPNPSAGVVSISDLTDVAQGDLYRALKYSFCKGKEWMEQPLKPSELERAILLARQRYADPAWTLSR